MSNTIRHSFFFDGPRCEAIGRAKDAQEEIKVAYDGEATYNEPSYDDDSKCAELRFYTPEKLNYRTLHIILNQLAHLGHPAHSMNNED